MLHNTARQLKNRTESNYWVTIYTSGKIYTNTSDSKSDSLPLQHSPCSVNQVTASEMGTNLMDSIPNREDRARERQSQPLQLAVCLTAAFCLTEGSTASAVRISGLEPMFILFCVVSGKSQSLCTSISLSVKLGHKPLRKLKLDRGCGCTTL